MVEVGRQMMKAEVVRPTEFAKMMHIRKERYSRRHAGKHVVWLVADKYRQYLLVSQKLNWVKDYIDKHLASAPCDTVSISGLYSCAGSKDGRHGGFHKHRWAVVCAPLEDARDAIESLRPRFDNAVVLGSDTCYEVQ